jgi:hypothetical protein
MTDISPVTTTCDDGNNVNHSPPAPPPPVQDTSVSAIKRNVVSHETLTKYFLRSKMTQEEQDKFFEALGKLILLSIVCPDEYQYYDEKNQCVAFVNNLKTHITNIAADPYDMFIEVFNECEKYLTQISRKYAESDTPCPYREAKKLIHNQIRMDVKNLFPTFSTREWREWDYTESEERSNEKEDKLLSKKRK